MGIQMREWPMIFYIFLIAGPIAITTVAVYESLEWLLSKAGREVPETYVRASAGLLDLLLKPLPDVSDAIPEETA